MPKIIKESGGGFIFDTEEELVNAMDQLLGDQNLRQEIGRRGYETLRQKWSPDVYIQRYLEIVEQLRVQKERSSRDEILSRVH
jgi:glycosyltransferase involved in cell wall biosynthesis